MIFDTVKPKGELRILLIDSFTNEIKQNIYIPNLVVQTGKEFIASRMISDTTYSVMSDMAIGDSNASLSTANDTLQSELARESFDDVSVTSNVITYSATFPAGTGTGAIVEAGLFNSDSPSIMLCRTTFPVVNKLAGDIISINWNVTIT